MLSAWTWIARSRLFTRRIAIETTPICFWLSFHPDVQRLTSVGWDKTVRIWDPGSGDAETGELLTTYLAQKIAIHTLASNLNGHLLASGGRDGAVRIWKIE